MRITVIMPKFNLRSSTSTDFLLKAKILKEFGHTITIVTTFSDQNKLIPDLPFDLREERNTDMSMFGTQKFAVKILKKYESITDVFYLSSDTYIFGGGWYRKFVKDSKPVVAYLNGYMDFVETLFKKFPLWPEDYLKKERGEQSFLGEIKYKMRIFLEKTIGVWFANSIDAFFVMSKTVIEYYIRAGIKREKTVMIPDFYDMDFLQGRALQPNPFDTYLKGTFHILFTGRIYMDKGPDLIIQAFSQMKNQDRSMLHMVGDGPQKSELEEFVKKNNLQDKILFHGWKSGDELLAFYQHADIFAQVTRLPEPLNRVGVEAMATGLPLVATNTSGESWIGEVAKVFEHGSVQDLTRTLDFMYEHPEKRKEMAENSSRRARDFDYKILGKQLDQVLRGLVSG